MKRSIEEEKGVISDPKDAVIDTEPEMGLAVSPGTGIVWCCVCNGCNAAVWLSVCDSRVCEERSDYSYLTGHRHTRKTVPGFRRCCCAGGGAGVVWETGTSTACSSTTNESWTDPRGTTRTGSSWRDKVSAPAISPPKARTTSSKEIPGAARPSSAANHSRSRPQSRDATACSGGREARDAKEVKEPIE